MYDNFLPFLLFIVVMCATPGPGNLTLLAIGQASGFRSALPFLLGTVAGHAVMDSMMAFGLARVFMALPGLALVMRWVGMAYICWLGWKIFCMRPNQGKAPGRATFWEGVILHPVSPKTWAMTAVAFSQLVDASAPLAPQIAVFVATILLCVLLFHCLWCLAGVWLLRLLGTPATQLAVSFAAVALMIGTTAWALFDNGLGQALPLVP